MAKDKAIEGEAVTDSAAVETALTFSSKGGKKHDGQLLVVSLAKIKIIKGFNPRTQLGDVSELVTGVAKEGLINPLTVRPFPSGKSGEYHLICGARRFKACTEVGLTSVPVIVRNDLDDDNAALALALAENSDDARHSVNAIDRGRAYLKLTEAGWSIDAVAKASAAHPQGVRRCLALVQAPDDVQKAVADGTMSMIAGLEVAKLDDSVRAAIKESLTADMSATQVRDMAKKAAKGMANPDAGSSAKKQTGAKRDAALVTWKSAKGKQADIQEFAYIVSNATDEERKTAQFFMFWGALGYALHMRGDLTDSLPPVPTVEDNDDPASAKKQLALLNKIIAAEAKKYVPPTDETPSSEDAAAE